MSQACIRGQTEYFEHIRDVESGNFKRIWKNGDKTFGRYDQGDEQPEEDNAVRQE